MSSSSIMNSRSTSDKILLGSVIFLAALGVLIFFQNLPSATATECHDISLPWMIRGVLPQWLNKSFRGNLMETVSSLYACTITYQSLYPAWTLSLFIIVYVSLQTLAIPGPIVLSIISGALYPMPFALALVAICATTGASFCFGLSYVFGKPFLKKTLPTKMLETFQSSVQTHRENLFYYMLFLRVTPLLPNWFVNVASPVVQVPFRTFFFGTLLGLIPANIFHVSTGLTLSSAAKDNSGNNTWNFITLFALQFVALLPTFFKSKLKNV